MAARCALMAARCALMAARCALMAACCALMAARCALMAARHHGICHPTSAMMAAHLRHDGGPARNT